MRDSQQIERRLREIAESMAAYATALIVSAHFRQLAGNVDIMPKALNQKSIDDLCALFEAEVKSERLRLDSALDAAAVTQLTRRVGADVAAKLADPNGGWKVIIPGRPVLNSFASAAKLNAARIKQMYIREAEQMNPSPFVEIVSLFGAFSQSSQPSAV